MADCRQCYSVEIVEGELTSASGKRYPISGGIPRILSEETATFIQRNRRSFSLEWKYFRYGERNWGMDIESRKRLFLRALQKDPDILNGQTMLDAGCGSGALSIEMANSFGLEVVALDLASGVEYAYSVNRSPFVHFVQASILELPVRSEAVDNIYCAGVLMHLPNTREAFDCLPRCLGPGGRLFVWLYHSIDHHRITGNYRQERIYEWLRSHVTSRLPIRAQDWLYRCLLVPFFLKKVLLNPFRSKKEDRNFREKMQNLVDTLSPVHANRHDEAEALEWFKSAGLDNVEVSYHDLYGFGVRGDAPVRVGRLRSAA